MALMQWEPLGELGTIQTEMNRLFSTFFEGSPPGNAGGGRWLPAMDLVETEDDHPSTTATAQATTAWSVAGGSSRGR